MLRFLAVRLAIVWALLLTVGLSTPSFAQDLPGPSVQPTKAAPVPALPSGFVAQTQGAPITDEHYRLGTGDKLKVSLLAAAGHEHADSRSAHVSRRSP